MPRAGSTLIEQILASHRRSRARWSCRTSLRSRKRLGGRAASGRRPPIPECLAALDAAELRGARRGISRAHADPAQDRPAVLHRQDAEQLGACRPDPPDPAQREDHRRPPPSARLLLLQLQAAFRPRPGLHLRPRRARPLLSRLCRADGAFRRRAARPRPPGDLRADGRRSRGRGAAAARLSRPAVRGGLPALLRERAGGAHRELRAGAPADQPRGARPVARLRALARPAEGRRSARCWTPIRTRRREA